MESPPRDIVSYRLLEAMREVGTLLIAFAPLDFAVSAVAAKDSWPYLLGFLVAGFFLLSYSIFVERRQQHG